MPSVVILIITNNLPPPLPLVISDNRSIVPDRSRITYFRLATCSSLSSFCAQLLSCSFSYAGSYGTGRCRWKSYSRWYIWWLNRWIACLDRPRLLSIYLSMYYCLNGRPSMDGMIMNISLSWVELSWLSGSSDWVSPRWVSSGCVAPA